MFYFIKFSLKYVPKCWINNEPTLIYTTAWRKQVYTDTARGIHKLNSESYNKNADL